MSVAPKTTGTREERLARAHQCLEGLSCGDAFGECFFGPKETALSLINARTIPPAPWLFTDDTLMAISIVSTLSNYGEIDQNQLAMSFAQNYDVERGYGAAMHDLLGKIRLGARWRQEAQALFGGTGSYGNGSAMRVAPLGAYFADDLDTVVGQAELSSVTTHCHPEAIAGAIAVAVAAALAWRWRNSDQEPCAAEFLRSIHERTPESAVRRGILNAMNLPPNTTIEQAISVLGNGWLISAPDTVPFALWSAAHNLDDYRKALWATVSGLGDRDTTCAIAGGVVVMYAGVGAIPREWLDCRESLPSATL